MDERIRAISEQIKLAINIYTMDWVVLRSYKYKVKTIIKSQLYKMMYGTNLSIGEKVFLGKNSIWLVCVMERFV